MVNNQLTAAYASQPVVIVGHDVRSSVSLDRKNRFLDSAPNADSYPYIMVDSGQQVHWNVGPGLAEIYSSMINAELGRPPEAEITAWYKRVGNHFQFTVQVTNQSAVALSSTNKATVHAIVYETFTDATRPEYSLVNNYTRATAMLSITPSLGINKTGTYTLTTIDLPSDVNWNNLHMLALVDYRPGVSSGPYDMLQAAFAQPASPTYTITPSSLGFMVNSQAAPAQTKQIRITSNSATLQWEAKVDVTWLQVTPASALAGTPAAVTLNPGALNPGSPPGNITFTLTDSGGFSSTKEIPVSAYLGEILRFYLPYNRQ